MLGMAEGIEALAEPIFVMGRQPPFNGRKLAPALPPRFYGSGRL